ncbi:AGE family epimerase/isomerase [Oerskovia sp. NPDC057915]|uniref:AGE family epimerase/isomerase n=1 Tax=Oerskovia sp. NPDC057915 TaxID=3346280 RepID=UPI0036D8B1FB
MDEPARTTDGAVWRHDELRRLLAFAQASLGPDGGARWLDDEGVPDPHEPVHTWITARTAHMYALGTLLGVPGADTLADLALDGLRTHLADPTDGGWFASRGPGDAVDDTKSAYAHAFVVLAASSATIAGRPGARGLLDDALRILDQEFWEADQGMLRDEWDRAWTTCTPYRGANANMHGVEALLAAHSATGDRRWLERASAIADRVVGWAAAQDWRVVEHFDAEWRPELELNAEHPADQFKPYGSTPGHGFEWARLLLQLDAAQASAGTGTPGARLDAAENLFDRAAADGWDRAEGGFVYTVNWFGRPVERRRFHWVATEAIAAAEVFAQVTGDERYAQLADDWWAYARAHLVDVERGSWHHELDAHNRPSAVVWDGKPDVYHAGQALLLADVPVTGSLAESVRAWRAQRVLPPSAE